VSTIRFLTSDDELYALVPPLRTAAEAIAKIIS
jgi:hypothetical protein